MDGFNSQNRRDFLRYFFGTAAVLTGFPMLSAELLKQQDLVKLSILYTNDTHSRIEAFPDNDAKFPGMGGVAKRAAKITEIRRDSENVLLLDAGDIFQGTPYFNLFHGELEYKLMTQMRYDACTLGNHDFDLGIENLIQQMPHARFDFINCNYTLTDTALHDKVVPYKIYVKNGIKIGVLGVGIDLQGLVDKTRTGHLVYNDPIEKSNATAKLLKNDLGCHYVICLSHLGYKYEEKKVSDILLAEQSENINLIIGGHTHTFLEHPVVVANKVQRDVYVTQAGWAGVWLGHIDVYFSHDKKKISHNSTNIKI